MPAGAICINVFAHHVPPDIRLALFAATLLLFGCIRAWFCIGVRPLWMPLPLAAFLVAFMVWVAESIGTMAGTWAYSGQHWTEMVSFFKMESCYLLPFAASVMVTLVMRAFPCRTAQCPPRRARPHPQSTRRPLMRRALSILLSRARDAWRPEAALASLTICTALAAPAAAQAACRQALALGLDVSGSVGLDEYRLQLDGLATALSDPEVAAAILAGADRPVVLAVFEWSDESFQRLLIDWIAITSPETLASVARRLRDTPRTTAPHTTAIGAAMLFGAALLARAPACPKRTLDLSGDGRNNAGPRPQDVRDSGPMTGIVVNGLTIGGGLMDHGDVTLGALSAYYRAQVIRGSGAFVMTAERFEDYAGAMARKLLKELEGTPMTALPGPNSRLASNP